MKRYAAKRLAGFLVIVVGVSILSFSLISFSGKDPAEILARRVNINASQETIEAIRVDMGLDAPMHIRYLRWVKGLFMGDLGVSLYSSQPVFQDIKELFPPTLILVGMALFWMVLLGIPLSLLCARYRDGVMDHTVRGLSMLGICMPTFWLGFLLLLKFAVDIPIFKVMPEPGVKGYILPSFALMLPVLSGLVRLFRSTLLAELSSDYVRYAKARGLSPWRILLGHATRNALPPVITLFCQYLGYLIAGSAVVESVFSIKGMGSYLVSCVLASDATATATCIMIVASIFVASNLAGDIINRMLCPWIVRESNA